MPKPMGTNPHTGGTPANFFLEAFGSVPDSGDRPRILRVSMLVDADLG